MERSFKNLNHIVSLLRLIILRWLPNLLRVKAKIHTVANNIAPTASLNFLPTTLILVHFAPSMRSPCYFCNTQASNPLRIFSPVVLLAWYVLPDFLPLLVCLNITSVTSTLTALFKISNCLPESQAFLYSF